MITVGTRASRAHILTHSQRGRGGRVTTEHVRSEVVQSKPEDLVGANPGIAVRFQQKGLLEAQHLVFISLTHTNIRGHTHYSSEIIPC